MLMSKILRSNSELIISSLFGTLDRDAPKKLRGITHTISVLLHKLVSQCAVHSLSGGPDG
ncbi:26328_t:CDS:2 [Dentiscutata erythropus]|uniref:26328_t:CDS:1 n=1 Tax=Dentiscutata erythropus TaxID=1348616 RepID=A0A9N8W142_9GLOM|nr:26328_t:CDS:2 [Dentiscutata erythropus]